MIKRLQEESQTSTRITTRPRAVILIPTAETARVEERVILTLCLLVVGFGVVVARDLSVGTLCIGHEFGECVVVGFRDGLGLKERCAVVSVRCHRCNTDE